MSKLLFNIDEIMTKFLAYLIYIVARLLTATLRVRYIGEKNTVDAAQISPSGRYIYALWHQNLLMALSSHSHETCAMIVSSSKDGEIVATACQNYGHLPVRGSSHRGAIKSLLSMIEVLKQGKHNGAITIDGPKGPLYEAKRGIIDIAKKSGATIVPLSPYPEKYWEFKSWDKFRLPKPFSRVIVHYSKPIEIQSDLPLDQYDQACQQIKESLFAGEQQAKKELTPP